MALHCCSGKVCHHPFTGPQARPFTKAARRAPSGAKRLRSSRTVIRAAAEEDDFEKRLATLRKAKGATPYGEGAKAKKVKGSTSVDDVPPKQSQQQPKNDFSNEQLFYEGPPHVGDLVTNIALGTTLLWLPLTIAAVGRYAFVKYRFTDLRLVVSTTAPWKTESSSVPYADVADVKTVGRGIGLWGDMVITLSNGDKVELRALDRFLEIRKYILERRDLLKPSKDINPMEDDFSEVKGGKGFA